MPFKRGCTSSEEPAAAVAADEDDVGFAGFADFGAFAVDAEGSVRNGGLKGLFGR